MRNHYIPQFLLREWVTNIDSKIEAFRLDIKGIPSSRQSPTGTAYEDNLYALSRDQVAGMSKHAIEKKFLSIVDSKAALAHGKLCTQGIDILSSDEKQDWARFLMSLRVRQPEIVSLLLNSSEQQFRESLLSQPEKYKELAGKSDPSTFQEWTETHFPGLIENFGLTFFHKLVDNQMVGEKILNLKWLIWDFSNLKNHLLLADHPCIYTLGIDKDNLVIALPLSPTKVFMAIRNERIHELLRMQTPKTLMTRINESSIAQSKKRIYASDDSPRRFIINKMAQLRI